jgi:hypothetical protein
MNPLVFLILRAERDLKVEQEKYLPKYDDIKTSRPVPNPKKRTASALVPAWNHKKAVSARK